MGAKQGKGKWKNGKGDSYVGEWNHSMIEGKGLYEYSNGDKYEGQWKNNSKHGHGK